MAEKENRMPVWQGWETVRLIGRGSFGAVYEIRRDMFGETERCAMKHISVPQSENEILELRSEGQDEESISRTFAEQARAILTEYKLMTRLNSCPNVVACHDVSFVEKNGGLGWDIDIRMELLTPLMQRLSEQQGWPESEILRLGKDMARALCACGELSIVHRDVKPQNIFVAASGRYKLGDFGIARTMEKTGSATMRTGTFAYMAPEVYHGKHYGAAADQYSLGMVLYWLLNGRRGPFVGENTPREKEAALYRRMSGEIIPPPAHGSEELKRIVLKCCAFDPEERFGSPEELLKALDNPEFGVRNWEWSPEGRKERIDPQGAKKSPFTIEEKKAERSDRTAEQKGLKNKTAQKTGTGDQGSADTGRNEKKRWIPILIGAAAAVLALVLLLPKGGQKLKTVAAPTEKPVVTEEPAVAATAAPTAEPTPEPVSWVEGDWSWSLADGVLTISGTGNMAENYDRYDQPWGDRLEEITQVVIEDGITSIGGVAFFDCSCLTKAEIPKTVTSIGVGAFGACDHLRSIEVDEENKFFNSDEGVLFSEDGHVLICFPAGNDKTAYVVPGSVTSIEKWAFLGCNSLTSVELSEGVTTICDSAFSDCQNLASVKIPGSVTTIEAWAFGNCVALREIVIPESVTFMGEEAFWDCRSLTAIEVESGNPSYRSVDGVLFSKDGKTLVCCPAGSARTEYAVPEGVTAFGAGAFCSCDKLTSFEVPEGVTSIGMDAFWGCGSLSRVEIPESVATIGDMAFGACSNLRTIEVESGNQNYRSRDGVLFSKDGRTLVCYPAGMNQNEYVIPPGVTSIYDSAFEASEMLSAVEIPDGVTTIGRSVFCWCYDLEEVMIPESVTSIGDYAFAFCQSLNGIRIPESMQSIGESAFVGCSSLTDLYYAGTKAQWEAMVGETRLTLPEGIVIHFEG